MTFTQRDRVIPARGLAAISGLACVVLVVAAQRFADSQPEALTTPPHLIRAFYALHRTHIGLSTYLGALGLTAFLCFVTALKSVLAKVEEKESVLPQLAFAGGVGAVAFALLADLFLATLAFRASSMDTQTAWILFTLWNMTLTFVCFPAALLVGSTSLVIVRTRVLPRLLGVLGFLLAIACLVAPTSAHHTSGPLVYGGAYLFPLLAACLVWVLAISTGLVLRSNLLLADPARGHTYSNPGRPLEHPGPVLEDDVGWSEALS